MAHVHGIRGDGSGEMTALERKFEEPSEWWDEYEARKAEYYKRLTIGKTCLDCAKCVRSERHPDEGWCTEDGVFRYDDDRPYEDGMECFAA